MLVKCLVGGAALGVAMVTAATASGGDGPIPLSAEEKTHLSTWLQSEQQAGRVNPFGDPVQTMYMGGSPLFDESTGRIKELHDYVVEQHPERPWHSALGSYQGCASNAGGGGLLAGGFHERNPSEDDVQEIASFAARELRGNLVEVQCPRTQVVAGINYSMTVIVEFPSTDVVRRAFHVVVFKPLPHTGQPPSLKTADDLGAVPVDD